jgi:CNT family concentrative nucleoside transporter
MPYLQLQSALGLAVIILIAWLLSEDRKRFPWRLVLVGLALQIGLAVLLTWVPPARDAILALSVVVEGIQRATGAGTAYVFGHVGGGKTPFTVVDPSALTSIAFQLLPIVLVMSALSALLWHWRILPLTVGAFAFLLQRTMKIGGAIGVGCASNVFLGMIESPLVIRPYLSRLSRGEMFILLTVGLATVAGTVLVIYAAMLENTVPGALGHILVASIISLPASIVVARLMIPDDRMTPANAEVGLGYSSSMHAVAQGTEDGLRLFLSIVAMLIVVVALVAIANGILGWASSLVGLETPLTFEMLLGWLFAPIVWLLGIPWQEAVTAGALMGVKTILNEFIAYAQMSALPPEALSPRSRLIMVYALCGFANLGSAGMMMGALSALVPERKEEIISLSLRAIVSGTLATCMTGAVIGLLP